MRARNDALLACTVTVVTAVVLGLWSWAPSFWYDEAATLRLARLPLSELFAFLSERDAVHGLYAVFMHGWIAVFGESELAVRLPSVLASAIAAGGTYLLTRRLGGSVGGGVLAATVLALLPRVAVQSVEARSYALALALIVGSMLLLYTATTTRRRRWWLAYTVAMTLAIWCFAYAALVLPACALLAAHWAARAREGWIAALPPALLSAPLVLVMLGQRGQVAWLEQQAVNPWTVLVEPFFGWAAWLLLAAVAVIGIGIARGAIRWTAITRALSVWLFLPGLLLVCAGLITDPLFTPRYLIVSAPALALLMGLAASAWSARATVAACIAWALLAAPSLVGSRLPAAKPSGQNLRAVAETISSSALPGDGFLLSIEDPSALRARTVLAAYPRAFDSLIDLAFVAPFTRTGTFWDEVRTPDPADLGGVERVWTLDREGSDAFAATLVSAGYAPTASELITGLKLTLWERPVV